MIIHSTRILTTEQKIAQTAVENPDILETTLLSPTQVHISAKTTGVTKVNLWDENKKLYTIRVLVVGDVRELALILRTAFPSDALKVTPVATSVMISGFVDKAEHIDRIVQIAEQYYPKVINNMTVGGCQQVSLHVKIMEVSRTKLRRLGFDWAKITGSNTVMSAASGLLSPPSSPTLVSGVGSIPLAPATTAGNPLTGTFAFNIANGSSAFFGVLNAMAEDDLAKILAEPTLTTISGRPASFRAGGSFFIVPNGQNGGPPLTVNYGTQINFVPIVLGNGRIRLEVRSTISEPDPSHTRTIPARSDGSQRRHGRRTRGGSDPGDCGAGAKPHRGVQRRAALDQRRPLFRSGVSLGPRADERGRTADSRYARVGRSDGRVRRAALRAGHADRKPERLGIVYEGAPRSAEVPAAGRAGLVREV